MGMDTLVLSDSYIPMGRIPWQVAICDVLSGRCEILEAYEGRVIRTSSEVFPMPSVIRFVNKVVGFFRRKIKFNRKSIWLRDKGACQYCATKVTMSEFTYDHVIPISQGGKTVWANIVVCCFGCNQKKRDRTPAQAGMRLLVAPTTPKHLPSDQRFNTWGDPATMPESWRDYLGSYVYWNAPLTT